MKSTEPFRIDDSRIPVTLGSALKVPSYAYNNWGIPVGQYRIESADCYTDEWEGGSPRQMEYVVEAIKKSGLGNFSQMLRDSNAKVVSHIIGKIDEKVNYLEPGAGVSTVNLYQKMSDDNIDLDMVFSTLIEPSAERMEECAEDLKKMGLKEGKNFKSYPGMKDVDALRLVGPKTQDIVGTVAQIHHHSYLDTPLATLSAVLKSNGYLVSSDWHNSMWEHPNRVYTFLKDNFEWEGKENDLQAFCHMYPKALEEAPKLSGNDLNANKMIQRFWKAWEEVRTNAINIGEFKPEDDILMLEAHKPVERYIEEGKKNRLNIGRGVIDLYTDEIMKWIPADPLLEDSSILYTTVLQKTPGNNALPSDW